MAEHTQHVLADKKDRERLNKQFKEDRAWKQEQKDKRFAAMRAARKDKPKDAGGPNGIHIEVTGD